MKPRVRLYYRIAGGVLVGIIIGTCISLLNEPTAVEQVEPTPQPEPTAVEQVEPTPQPEPTGKDWWEMDDRDWFDNTPEGQDLSSRLMSGELSVGDMNFIFDEMGEGHTYNEARQRIGQGMARLRRIADSPKRFGESAIEGDWRPVTKEWWETQEKSAGRTGWVGAAVIGMGDILVSSVRAVSVAVPEIIAGRESGGQAFGLLAIVLLMVWVTRRVAKIIERAERGTIARFKDGK